MKRKKSAYLAGLARAWLFLRLLRAAGRLRGWLRFNSFLFFAPLPLLFQALLALEPHTALE